MVLFIDLCVYAFWRFRFGVGDVLILFAWVFCFIVWFWLLLIVLRCVILCMLVWVDASACCVCFLVIVRWWVVSCYAVVGFGRVVVIAALLVVYGFSW